MPKCPKDCKKHNPFIFRKVVIPAVVDNDTINPPANGAYCNAVVVYEATGNVYLYSSDGIPTSLSSTDYNLLSNLPSINGKVLRGDVALSDLGISQLVEEEAHIRATADGILQRQIDAITVASDVVDIVGTYEELEEYDTSKLKENDIVKVLSDETIGGATAYYRWVNGAWQYIGQEGPYYTKSQTDALLDQKMDVTSLDDYYTKTETDTLLAAKASVSDLANKQDTLIAGSNITIDPATNVISATVPSLTNYYTKSETYNQTEVDNLISGVRADIPTNTSDLLNDSGFLTSIPTASSSVLGGIKVGSGLSIAQDGTLSATGTSITVDSALSTTSTNPVENRVITNALNGKANTSDIPTVPTNVSSFYNDAGYLTSTDVASNYYNKSETYTQAQVNALIPTKTSNLVNDGSDGTSTYVEADDLATVATSGSYNDLTDKPSIMTGLVEMSYGESNAWAKFIAAYQAKQIVYCRASSNSNPASGSQTRKAFMAYVNNADNPTEVEFQYVRSVSSKTSSQPVDQVFVYKLTSSNGGTWTVQTRDMAPKLANGTNTTVSYSNGTYTVNATQPTVNNATLTIQKNGTDVQTFTANQATNVTANITVPTKTSDLTNDSNFVSDASYVHTDNNYTTADKNKLAGIAAGAEVNVQADWNESNSSSDAYIQNKPTIGNATLTVQKNGTTLDTFTANATANKTINIPVPTKTSDLTNDSGYVVDDGDIACTDTEGGFAQITNPTSHNVAPLSLTHLYGNATQETLSGKNLVNINGTINSSNVATITASGQSLTITTNATATTARATIPIKYEANRQMTISFDSTCLIYEPTASNSSVVYMRTVGGSDPLNPAITLEHTVGTTVHHYTTITTDNTLTRELWLYLKSSPVAGVVSYRFDNIQIEYGASETSYEPYCGGSPMPNPQFPSPVETVTGAQTVQITGKNLAQIDDISQTNQSVNYYRDVSMQHRPALVAGTTYTFSADITIGGSETSCTVSIGAGSTSFLSEVYSRNNQQSGRVVMTFTPTTAQLANGANFFLRFPRFSSPKTGIDFSLRNAMLELGSMASDYEPYQSQSQVINLGGQNLIHGADNTNYGVSTTYNSTTGLFTVSGTPANSNVQLSINIYENIKAGTYTLSTTKASSFIKRIRAFHSDNTYDEIAISANGTSATGTFTADIVRYNILASMTVGTAVNDSFGLQLNKGSMAIPYAPYTTYAYELAKIGTYQDYIWNDDGTWKIHKAINKIVLDGTENWALAAMFYCTNKVTPLAVQPTYAQVLSDYYTPSSGAVADPSIDIVNGYILRIKDTSKADVATFKTWLGTHNTTVYYPLATPTDTEITDSELIEQLNHIYSLYQGTNNLWLVPSAGAQGEMTLCASLSQLPVATTQRLGAVMVGDGLTIAENGELSISSRFYEIIIPDDVPTGTYDYDYDGGMGALVLALGREWERSSIVIKDNNGNALTPENIEALGAENLDITFALRVPAMEGVSASGQTWDVPAFLGYFKIDSFAPAATDGGTWSMRGRCYDAGDAQYLIEIHNYEEDDVQSFSAALYIPNAMVVRP